MKIVRFGKCWKIPFPSTQLSRFHDARVEGNRHHLVTTRRTISLASLSRTTYPKAIVQASALIYRPPIHPHHQPSYPPNLSANANHTPTHHLSPPSTTLMLPYRLHLQIPLSEHASPTAPFLAAASNLKTKQNPIHPAPKALQAQHPSQTVRIRRLDLAPSPSTILAQWRFRSQKSIITAPPATQAAVTAAHRSVAVLQTTSDVLTPILEAINPAHTNRPPLSP